LVARNIKARGNTDATRDIRIEDAPLVGDAAVFFEEDGCAHYFAYGLRIRSELALPELAESGSAADVTIRFGSVDHSQMGLPEDGLLWATEDEACISFAGIGSFLVRGGREIVVDPAPGEDERWVRNAVLGPVMGALLYQRGWLTLHASATSSGGAAVAFMADQRWGKSTMAAAMCAHGHHLVADDITAVKNDGDRPIVSPGYPLLKLWPEAAAAVGENPAALLEIMPNVHKRGLRARRESSPEPLPLGCIYVLDQGDAPEIEPLRSQEALIEVVRNTYGRRLFQAVRTGSHLHQCADVINSVPVRRLKRPYSLTALSDVVRLVEEDLAQIASDVRQ
jgi:hypothetical protein